MTDRGEERNTLTDRQAQTRQTDDHTHKQKKQRKKKKKNGRKKQKRRDIYKNKSDKNS